MLLSSKIFLFWSLTIVITGFSGQCYIHQDHFTVISAVSRQRLSPIFNKQLEWFAT